MDHGPLHADLALGTPRRFAVAGLVLAVSALVAFWAFLMVAFNSPIAGLATLVVQALFGGSLGAWARIDDPSRRAPVTRAVAGAIALPAVLVLVVLGVRLLTA